MTTYNPPTPLQNFIDKKGPVVGATWLNAIDQILQGKVPATGVYQPAFLSGQVQVTGADGNLASFGDLTFGLNLPGPGGTGPALLIGGAGKPFAQIITDEQIAGQHGIDLFIAGGSTQPSGNDAGGKLWLFGGASWSGVGGPLFLQGGTSVHGHGGDVQIQGGSSTDGSAGNVYIIAGTTGSQGGGVKIYATKFGGGAGDISFWLGQPDIPHSVPLWTMSSTGALFPGNQGAGNPANSAVAIVPGVLVSGGNLASPSWGLVGVAGVLGLQMSGSMTVTNAPINYATDGRTATLWCEQFIVGDSTGFNDIILSTLPATLVPSQDRWIPCSNVQDNNVGQYQGVAHVDTLGGVTISLVNITGHAQTILNNYTAGGQKGITTGWCITYPL